MNISVPKGVKRCCCGSSQAIHGTLKTIEGPPNLGINLPLSAKPTNSNSANSNIPKNNNKNGENVFCQDKGEKKPSSSPLKTTNSNCAADLKSAVTSGYTCGECNASLRSRELFVTHMKREHGKVNVLQCCF